MVQKIDDLDRAIVAFLQEDGRMSSAEIARRIGYVSQRAVRYRIDRLIEKGIVRIHALVDPKSLGYGVVGDIYLKVESGHVDKVAREIAQFECVCYVAFSLGDRDISLQVNARSTEELYRFATEVLGAMPWVHSTVTTIVPHKVKDIHEWQIPASPCLDTDG